MTRVAACLLLGLLLAACSRPPEVYSERILTFGTLVDISIYGVDREQAQRGFNAVRAHFRQLHQDWHAWKAGALHDLNDAIARGERFTPHPSLLPLIRRGQALSVASDGLFDPAVGRLISLWGFHSEEWGERPLPDADTIAKLVAAGPSMTDLHIDGATVYCDNPLVKLDFGGFAKGVAIDGAIDILKRLGIENAVINAGGDLRAIGRHGERPWRIGIRHPRNGGVLAALETHGDEAVFTSGDYERFFERDGRRYHHIIDPRTGYPSQGTASLTVITAADAGLADAAATALFVAGPQRWREIAARMGLRHVLLVDTDGNVYITRPMAERVTFQDQPERLITVADPLEEARP
jgi:thiamine biosynthesis lipoprotein